MSVLVQIKGSSWGSAWGGGTLTDHLQALLGVFGIDAVELLLEFHDLFCLNGDVCGLALGDVPRGRRLEPRRPLTGGWGWRWVSRAPSGLQIVSVQAGGTGLCESLYILLHPHHHQEGFLD